MFSVAGAFGYKYLLILGGVIWAVADAFASGTDDAMMYETMEELRKTDKYDILYARSKTFGQIGMGLGALIAALVYVVVSIIIKFAGTKWVDKLLPPVIIGPTVALIGLSLCGSAINNVTISTH